MYVRLVTGTGDPSGGSASGLEGGAGSGLGYFPDRDADGYPDDLPDDSVVSK